MSSMAMVRQLRTGWPKLARPDQIDGSSSPGFLVSGKSWRARRSAATFDQLPDYAKGFVGILDNAGRFISDVAHVISLQTKRNHRFTHFDGNGCLGGVMPLNQ